MIARNEALPELTGWREFGFCVACDYKVFIDNNCIKIDNSYARRPGSSLPEM